MICFVVLFGTLGFGDAVNSTDDEIIVDLEFFKITNITKAPNSTTNFKTTINDSQIENFIDLLKKCFHSVLIFCLIMLIIFIIYSSVCLICRSISDSESIYEKFSENDRGQERGQGDLSIQEGDQSVVATSIRLLHENHNNDEIRPQNPKKGKKFFKFSKKDSQRKLINQSINLDSTQL
ncbi:hypothetical protein BpHYR1_006296 [Brachionus plicatilis]|uniref:Uncharacterized protein n=1 Tax=Brachionus plicatilis TaxID=10195 RepID=A0A3M7RLP8_BRAPC|nr:hypothetical protein BpHYR1_006296 [Brachionus plicatilis]